MTRDNLQFIGVTKQVHYLGNLVLDNRMARAMSEGVSRYPIYRVLRFAARVELEVLFDAIALDPAWRAERINAEAVLVDGEGVFVAAYGSRKADYCSCNFYVWAADVARAEEAKAAPARQGRLHAHHRADVLDRLDTSSPRAAIWRARTIEELADDVLRDRAYPEIKGGVRGFIARYLDAPETVLVLQGPPGTGKTRLIRGILGEMSRRKGEPAQALYTGDMKALASDEIFVKFITGTHDAFVVEDADHLLKPRADGNEHLHRFLTIADGVVRSQGRKIIFSTNLPNVGDLDDALHPARTLLRAHPRAHTDGSGSKGAGGRDRLPGLHPGRPQALARRDLPRAALTPEHLPRPRAGRLAVAPHNLAVDQNGFDSLRRLDRLLESGGLVDLRIEDRDVGRVTRLEHAAVGEAEGLGGETGHLVDGGFQRKKPKLARVVSEDSRKRAPQPRMRRGVVRQAV